MLCGLGVRVHRADVCRAGARLDPHPEGEAETEALQSWDLTHGSGLSDPSLPGHQRPRMIHFIKAKIIL